MRRLLILLIKFIPVIQMTGMLLNNTAYYFGINNELSYTFDFLIGNSIVTTFLIYLCSYIFNFCIWHRLIITANLINLIIANIDAIIRLPITDIQLLIIYYIIASIFIIYSTIIHICKKKMINSRLRVLRGLLEECINNIDAGNSNHSEEELDYIIKDLTKLNRGIKRISKREACERILHCSPSTFDNYLKIGLIPPGHKEYGFKELSWSEKDFDEATLYRIKDYRDKHK